MARFALGIYVAATFLTACGGSQAPIGAPGAMPQGRGSLPRTTSREVLGNAAAPFPLRGIYASEYLNSGTNLFGFAHNNRGNGPPLCKQSVPDAEGIAVDGKGNLIVPQFSDKVSIFKGPRMCGRELGSFRTISNDGPVNAASADAAHSTIAVGAYQDGGSGYGSIELCTLKAGCTKNLTNNYLMNEVVAVAMSNTGDCWASSAAPTELTYFKGCAEPAQTVRGYMNGYPGGLDIDNQGNLVAISDTSQVYVYSGCKPTCKRVGGPFALQGAALYGHLNENSTRFVTADYQYGQVDVYKYTPTAITYLYSFNNDLSRSILGAAYDPRSKQ